MTISTEVRKAGPFIGNGSASSFPFAFKVFKAADLIVVRRQDNIGVETTLVLDSDYHVTLNVNQDTTPGGVVSLTGGALADGFTLIVSSELPYLQTTDLTNQGGFYPKVITNALDRLTIFCQQLAENLGRTLKLPITAPTNISTEIPLPNPSELLAWNETGTGLTTVSPQSLVTSIAYGTATADLFAGDGVTTTFPLTTNPASVNNLDVSIGGYSQRPVQDGVGDYSWNGGASITFVTPPPAPSSPGDKNVLVRYMQAVPVSDSEALHAQTREALRRSYAEAGYNLVQGSFEKGGVLTSTSDVLLHENGGKAYSWSGAYPSGGYIVPPNADPTMVGFDRIDIYENRRVDNIDELRSLSGLTKGQTLSLISFHAGWAAVAKPPIGGGDFVVDAADTTAADNGGTVIICTDGVRVKRITNGLNKPEWFGAKADGATDDSIAFSKALNSNPARLDLCGGKTYRILNVRIPYAESTVIEGNNATVKIASTSRVGEHDCCLWYSNIASIGDTLRSTDNNTMTINNLNFASDAGVGGVGFRYIVANHLTLNECKTSGYLTEGIRIGACNDIHFENCNLGGDTAVRCIYNENDPYSASFADVSFNDGIYVNGGTVFGNNIGIDYEGSSAEGVINVLDVVLIGSSVAGIRAANFRNLEVSGCWTEFYKAGSSQILLVADGAGVESDIAHIHNNFFTSYDFQSAGHIPSNIIKSSAHSCVIEDNYFQLQSMPTEAVINFNSGNAAATFKRTHVGFTDVDSGTQAYGICSYEHFGDGQMILSAPEFYGIITDSAGNKFVARVYQTTSTGMKMVYYSYNEVFENFANPISSIPANFKSSNAGFILKDTLVAKLVNGYGTFEPFLGNGTSATTIIGRNTFIMSTDTNARNKLFNVTFGDMQILPNNRYILV